MTAKTTGARRWPEPRPKTLRAVRPNAGIEAAYRKKLDALIAEMQRSLVYWIKATWRGNEPEMLELGQDAPEGSFGSGMSPAMALREQMKKLGRQWQKRFDQAAPKLAEWFATKATERADAALRSILRDAGLSVRFKMTAAANDVLQATIGEQVGLIKSIAAEHLTEVQGMVMRSVAAGRDLSTLTEDLQKRYAVTRRRAETIARDQNNKATATITRTRRVELGITEAIWLHSAGGKQPRPSHVKASGKKFDIRKGMLIDGEYIQPGEKINCRCVSRPVIPGLSA